MTAMTHTSVSSNVEFDFDAMLMYGWVANSERTVLRVNRSLRHWISSRADLGGLLDDIDIGTVSIRDLHQQIVDSVEEAEIPGLIDTCLARLEAYIEQLNTESRDRVPRDRREQNGNYLARFLHQKVGAAIPPLLGVRCVREGGTLLAGGDNARRVDLIIVVIMRRDPAVGRWVLQGFQGQLQEAWSRIEGALETATNAAAIALMSRNLSHNIGSHSLFWLAQSESDDDRRRFYRYLQARMELLGAFATDMPLSPATYSLTRVVEEFKTNTMLLQTLCQTEGVERIDIRVVTPDDDDVSFPGGDLGIQALFALMENCIRDSAKFASRSDRRSLSMSVVAEEEDDLLCVRIFDDTNNYAEVGEAIQAAIESITFVTAGGELVSGHWGIKERFICATILRQTRPDQLRVGERERSAALGTQKPDGKHRILDVENVNGNLGWTFYLLKPEPSILHVSPTGGKKGPRNADLETVSLDVFRFRLGTRRPVGGSYFVAHDLPRSELQLLQDNRAKLPDRCFRSGSTSKISQFIRLSGRDEEELTPEVLQRRSAEALCASALPVVVLGDKVTEKAQISSDPDVWVVPATDGWAFSMSQPVTRKVIFVQHHYIAIPLEIPSNVIHYEPFEGGEELERFFGLCYDRGVPTASVRYHALRLIEAALTRILIADERIDPASAIRPCATGRFSEKDRLHWAGIDLMGIEYGATAGDLSAEPLFRALSADYQLLVLHRGIIDKILLHDRFPNVECLIAALRSRVPRLVVHSGRMDAGALPRDVKLQSLSNVTRWLDTHASKLRIVEELSNLRRLE